MDTTENARPVKGSKSQEITIRRDRLAILEEAYWTEMPTRAGKVFHFFKRFFDILVSLAGLIITLPLWIIIAITIKIESSGPILFRQLRSGKKNAPFTMFKFRSMHAGAEQYKDALKTLNEMDGPVFKIKDDPRVTRFGRFLRRWSLDELPQLLNVLRGKMSLVGPRPLPVGEVANMAESEMRRHSVKPGMTCIWQISGRNEIPFEEWIQLDLIYVDNQSFPLDLEIFFRTFLAILRRKGSV